MENKKLMTHMNVPAESTDFERVFNALPGTYAVVSIPEYCIIAATDSFCASTYRSREELAGMPITDVLPESPSMQRAEARSVLYEALTEVRRTKQPMALGVVRYDIARPDAMGGGTEEHWWRINEIPVLDERHEVMYIIHSAEEVTQVLSALEELETAAKRRTNNF